MGLGRCRDRRGPRAEPPSRARPQHPWSTRRDDAAGPLREDVPAPRDGSSSRAASERRRGHRRRSGTPEHGPPRAGHHRVAGRIRRPRMDELGRRQNPRATTIFVENVLGPRLARRRSLEDRLREGARATAALRRARDPPQFPAAGTRNTQYSLKHNITPSAPSRPIRRPSPRRTRPRAGRSRSARSSRRRRARSLHY